MTLSRKVLTASVLVLIPALACARSTSFNSPFQRRNDLDDVTDSEELELILRGLNLHANELWSRDWEEQDLEELNGIIRRVFPSEDDQQTRQNPPVDPDQYSGYYPPTQNPTPNRSQPVGRLQQELGNPVLFTVDRTLPPLPLTQQHNLRPSNLDHYAFPSGPRGGHSTPQTPAIADSLPPPRPLGEPSTPQTPAMEDSPLPPKTKKTGKSPTERQRNPTCMIFRCMEESEYEHDGMDFCELHKEGCCMGGGEEGCKRPKIVYTSRCKFHPIAKEPLSEKEQKYLDGLRKCGVRGCNVVVDEISTKCGYHGGPKLEDRKNQRKVKIQERLKW